MKRRSGSIFLAAAGISRLRFVCTLIYSRTCNRESVIFISSKSELEISFEHTLPRQQLVFSRDDAVSKCLYACTFGNISEKSVEWPCVYIYVHHSQFKCDLTI